MRVTFSHITRGFNRLSSIRTQVMLKSSTGLMVVGQKRLLHVHLEKWCVVGRHVRSNIQLDCQPRCKCVYLATGLCSPLESIVNHLTRAPKVELAGLFPAKRTSLTKFAIQPMMKSRSTRINDIPAFGFAYQSSTDVAKSVLLHLLGKKGRRGYTE